MPIYKLQIPFSGMLEMTIEANDVEEALEMAIESDFSLEIDSEDDDIEDCSVLDWDMHEKVKLSEVCCGNRAPTFEIIEDDD